MSDVTQLLSAIKRGDARAGDQLLPLVYGELSKGRSPKFIQRSGTS